MSPSSIMIGERNGDSIFLLLVTPINCKQGDNFVMQLSHMLDMHPNPSSTSRTKGTCFHTRRELGWLYITFPHSKFDWRLEGSSKNTRPAIGTVSDTLRSRSSNNPSPLPETMTETMSVRREFGQWNQTHFNYTCISTTVTCHHQYSHSW